MDEVDASIESVQRTNGNEQYISLIGRVDRKKGRLNEVEATFEVQFRIISHASQAVRLI